MPITSNQNTKTLNFSPKSFKLPHPCCGWAPLVGNWYSFRIQVCGTISCVYMHLRYRYDLLKYCVQNRTLWGTSSLPWMLLFVALDLFILLHNGIETLLNQSLRKNLIITFLDCLLSQTWHWCSEICASVASFSRILNKNIHAQHHVALTFSLLGTNG